MSESRRYYDVYEWVNISGDTGLLQTSIAPVVTTLTVVESHWTLKQIVLLPAQSPHGGSIHHSVSCVSCLVMFLSVWANGLSSTYSSGKGGLLPADFGMRTTVACLWAKLHIKLNYWIMFINLDCIILLKILKGIVLHNMKMVSSFTHPQVVLNSSFKYK